MAISEDKDRLPFLWWELVLLAVQIAFIGLVGVVISLMVFEL